MPASSFTRGVAPDAVATDDHAFAEWAATEAGRLLLQVRDSGLAGKELKNAGDREANELLLSLLAEHRPDDAVLSEESLASHGDATRLAADRVWIVDPLDGTREFSEPPRDDWAVHVALWSKGELTAGAVALPARDVTFSTASVKAPEAAPSQALRIAVSRTRAPALVHDVAETLGAELVAMGSAGVKVMAVIDGTADAYIHAGGQYEWDSAAPVAVARAAGAHTSRIDGGPLEYNQREVLLPDLVVCRSEVAEQVLSAIAAAPTEAVRPD
ncbi:3'(2'),5'-bisphosphate nucleotidase CysQ [Haloechinothrix halophila]|uniref:3'(2'),5'-bisphosphate nucleotidase CysQ n=1 Tax=Haloechinothrix halophila TaxID=1069073 RepID=UPI000412C6B5